MLKPIFKVWEKMESMERNWNNSILHDVTNKCLDIRPRIFIRHSSPVWDINSTHRINLRYYEDDLHYNSLRVKEGYKALYFDEAMEKVSPE